MLEIIVDTVTFSPKKIELTQVKLNDFLKQVATDIFTLLTQPPEPTTIPVEAGDTTKTHFFNLQQF